MTPRLGLIICDTSPLFTLALADALDTLLLPGVPISIPDAVYFEATRVRGAPGADRIQAWVSVNPTVRVDVTEVGLDQSRRFEDGRKARGLGEQAALEVLRRSLKRAIDASAVLLFEDSDLETYIGVLGARAAFVTTGDFLRELEAAGLIQSADRVLDMAALQGRNVDRLRRMRADERTAIWER